MHGFQGLSDRVRRVKESLVEVAVLPERRALLGADPRGGRTAGDQFHGVGAPGEIPAGLRHPAAGILDQRPDHQVCADGDRFFIFGEFAVAVVDNDIGAARPLFDEGGEFPDLVDRKRRTVEISLRALDERDLHGVALLGERLFDPVVVGKTVRFQGDLAVAHAEIEERPAPRLARQPDHLVEGVVGLAGKREQHVAGTEQSEQPDRQRVGPRDDRVADERRLAPEDLGVDLIQRIAPVVVQSVAVGGGKTGLAHPVVFESREDAGGKPLASFFDLPESRGERLLGLLDQFAYIGHFAVLSLA